MTETVFQLGEPVEHRGIVVAPLFPRHDPRARYVTLDEAIPRGLRIEEVGASGSVPELVVHSPVLENVLLYDGEELLGAKQNRILNVSVLAGPGSELRIPVSCVEEGRWRAVGAAFESAPHAAHPGLRRRKAESLRREPLARGVSQADVWDEVREKNTRMRVSSPTGASSDAYRSHADRLGELEQKFPLQSGQSGAVLVLGDSLCLDYVSRPDAFERLYPRLLRGYLLDALERLDRPRGDGVGAFVESVASAERTQRPSVGLGEDVRLEGADVVGSGLELDGELLQLSAFTSARESRRFGRIARPSRRQA